MHHWAKTALLSAMDGRVRPSGRLRDDSGFSVYGKLCLMYSSAHRRGVWRASSVIGWHYVLDHVIYFERPPRLVLEWAGTLYTEAQEGETATSFARRLP